MWHQSRSIDFAAHAAQVGCTQYWCTVLAYPKNPVDRSPLPAGEGGKAPPSRPRGRGALSRGVRLSRRGPSALLRSETAKRLRHPPGLPGYPGRLGEMGHLRRLGGRWSALGGAWPDPKGPGRCLPTPWVPWVRAVPIGPLRWPGGRSRGPESAVLPSGAMAGTQPVRPCTRTMRPAQVPELPVAGPHAPRGPTRSLRWARGG